MPPVAELLLNPAASRRTEGAQRLALELLEAALGLPDAEARARLAQVAGALHGLDPRRITGDDSRRAFWINVHNALARHAVYVIGPSRAGWRRVFPPVAAYRIGEQRWSLRVIAHGILRANRRPPGSVRRTLAPRDPRLAAAPAAFDPRVHFALNAGAPSDPPVRTYFDGQIGTHLELAARNAIRSEVRVLADRGELVLPRRLRAVRDDFGGTDGLVRFAAERLEPAERARLDANAGGLRVRWSDAGRMD